MAQTVTVSDVIPATPADIYMAWLDSVAHAAMTGGGKAEASPEVGGEHSAWDGYISGMNLALYPGQRIEQSWRSTDFKPEDADSTLTVVLDPVDGGTKVTLVHANLPDHQTGYEQGWRDWYLDPMKAYFAALGIPMAEPEPAAMEPERQKRERKTAARKAAAPKVTARKTAAKPPAATRRTAAKKPAARKVAAGKNAAKTAAKKPAGRKVAAKKPAARKVAAKKPSSRKAAAKKPAARKAAAKKPVTRKAAAKRRVARKAAATRKAPARKKRAASRKMAAGKKVAKKTGRGRR